MNEDKEYKPSIFNIYHYSTETASKGPFLLGFGIIIPLIIIFSLWAYIAPLSAAAIADGKIVLNKAHKTVQHLEGGIVEEILVSEGQNVAKDDPLLILQDVVQQANLATLENKFKITKMVHARLRAEYLGQEPEFEILNLDEKKDSTYVENVKLQQSLWLKRTSNLKNQIDLIKAAKKQTQTQIIGMEAQLAAIQKRETILAQEFDELTPLYAKGIVSKTRKFELEKQIIDIKGQIGQFQSDIARLGQQIVAYDVEILDAKTTYEQSILDEMQQVETEIQQLSNEIIANKDTLKRTIVYAPSSGKILNLSVHTKSAVIAPGSTIMDIIPQDDRLIVEAKVIPTDIDLVKPGLKAKVLLSAYKTKKLPKLDAVVETVSADAILDEATGLTYFLARIDVDQSILQDLKHEIKLYPGMPAQVFMMDQPRTLADYIIAPVVDATYRAFREE